MSQAVSAIASQVEHQTLDVGEVKLHVALAGPENGPLVVLLHGFPEFWYGWRHQVEPLAAAGYRVAVPDQRGYNTSDKPAGVKHYGFEPLANDVSGLIGALGRERATVVGHDWGAAIAWWTAISQPQSVERLAILNVPHPVVFQRFLRRSLGQLRKSWYMFFFQLPWLPERVLLAGDCKRALRGLQKTGHAGAFTAEDLDEYRAAWQQPGAMHGMINWYRAAFRVRLPRVESLRVQPPALIIWGMHDPFLDSRLAQASLDYCEDGRLEQIHEATHWVHHEQADRVNQLLSDFIGTH